MKKKLVTVVSVLAVLAAMLMMLCACSTFGSVKSAYEKAGYTAIEATEEQKSQLAGLIGEENVEKATLHGFKKDGGLIPDFAIVLEYKNGDELVEALRDNPTFKITDEDLKTAYDKLQEIDSINGNCVILLGTPAAYSVFKSSK